jgi:hypothetical protein
MLWLHHRRAEEDSRVADTMRDLHGAMQSTGVCWIAVYAILEEAGMEVHRVNARETKNLPGRKTDVQQSQWLMKLHTYGLLRNSFRPAQGESHPADVLALGRCRRVSE